MNTLRCIHKCNFSQKGIFRRTSKSPLQWIPGS